MIRATRRALASGITMHVAEAGPEDAPAAILLHGFPESHRTWRRIVPLLERDNRLIMPDLRGFGATDRPQEVAAYRTDILLDDLEALADSLGLERFALVGHDWGGALAWAAALRRNPRVTRLAIVNSPHPAIFQKSLIEDEAQRAASQYIRAFRNPGFERAVEAMGFPAFFDKSFAPHVDLAQLDREERSLYLADWRRPGALTAMLNWYRASEIVVPEPGEDASVPAWAKIGLPPLDIPLRVIWGMKDKALLPVQLEGMEAVSPDTTIIRLPDAGHFAPWEAPEAVADALRPFLADA